MKILITGANGFIGRHLCDYLTREQPQDSLYAVTRTPVTTHCAKNVVLDLSNEAETKRIFQEIKPDLVYHLAGIARIAPEITFMEYFRDNFLSTLSIVNGINNMRKDTRLFFASTTHVYGNQQGTVTEDSHHQPETDYGFTKYLAEQVLKHFAEKERCLKVVVGRLYNCLGPGQAKGYVVSDLCGKLASLPTNEPGVLKTGSLKGMRRFIDVRDIVTLLPKLMEIDSDRPFEVFNIASPYELTIREVLQKLLTISGRLPRIESQETGNPFLGLSLSTTKLEKNIALKFRPIDETLKDIWNVALQHSATLH